MDFQKICVCAVIMFLILIGTFFIGRFLEWVMEEEGFGFFFAWFMSAIGFGICLTIILFKYGII